MPRRNGMTGSNGHNLCFFLEVNSSISCFNSTILFRVLIVTYSRCLRKRGTSPTMNKRMSSRAPAPRELNVGNLRIEMQSRWLTWSETKRLTVTIITKSQKKRYKKQDIAPFAISNDPTVGVSVFHVRNQHGIIVNYVIDSSASTAINHVLKKSKTLLQNKTTKQKNCYVGLIETATVDLVPLNWI